MQVQEVAGKLIVLPIEMRLRVDQVEGLLDIMALLQLVSQILLEVEHTLQVGLKHLVG